MFKNIYYFFYPGIQKGTYWMIQIPDHSIKLSLRVSKVIARIKNCLRHFRMIDTFVKTGYGFYLCKLWVVVGFT